MRVRGLSLFAVGLLLGHAAGQGGDAKQELAQFQGRWRVEKLDLAEGPAPPEEVARLRFTFTGQRVVVTLDGKQVDEMTCKLHPATTPKAIDIIAGQGPNKGKVAQGIYAFEGDRLTICTGAPGQKRPGEFKSDRSSRTGVLVLRREKS